MKDQITNYRNFAVYTLEGPEVRLSLNRDRLCRGCFEAYLPKESKADDHYSYCSQKCETIGEANLPREA